ncbi:MAG: hypothetical protein ATN35_07910 [Epulopiscium sp. Nele67-Bin004]|nr:MAG: hypothetical protein ATN35_07910 [Epulopiscium sp. Nele67-Bin004]
MSSITFSGLASGIDTSAMVEAMLTSYQNKYDTEYKEQLLLELKLEKYQEVNAQVTDFYTNQVSTIRLEKAFSEMTTTLTNSNVIDLVSGGSDGDFIEILQTAEPAQVPTSAMALSDDSTLATLGIDEDATININGTDITLTSDMTIAEMKEEFSKNNVIAEVDESTGAITLSTTSRSLTLSGDLDKIGIDLGDEDSISIGVFTENPSITSDSLKTITSSTLLTDLGINENASFYINGTEISLADMTIDDLVNELNDMGISAKFDSKVGALSITATGMDIDLSPPDSLSSTELQAYNDALLALGIDTSNELVYESTQAIATYNGMTVTSDTNTFELDGIIFSAKEVGTVGINQSYNIDAIYDNIVEFVDAYNTLIEELNTLVNAEYNSDYMPLTSDEKAAMTDDEIELWEAKVEESLLRNDSTLTTLLSEMRITMMSQYETSDGGTISLAAIGITTSSDYTENGKLYIDEDTLREALTNNLDAVTDLFTGTEDSDGLGDVLHTQIYDKLKSSDSSSSWNIFNDKTLEALISYQEAEVDKALERMEAREAILNAKFLAMELAIQRLNAQASIFADTTTTS